MTSRSRRYSRRGIFGGGGQRNAEEAATHLLQASVEAVLNLQGLGSASALAKISGEWTQIVGERMGRHAVPVKIEQDDTLVVAVDHPVWATELRLMNSRVISAISNTFSASPINRLKVYVRPSNDLE